MFNPIQTKGILSVITILILTAACTPKPEDIYTAVEGNNLRQVKKIVELYPEVLTTEDDERNTPLEAAILNEKDEPIVSYLTTESLNLGGQDLAYAPFIFALQDDNFDLADIMLNSGYDINHEYQGDNRLMDGLTVLWMFTGRDLPSTHVEYLIENGLDVSTDSRSVYQPFHSAARTGNAEVVQALLNAGIDPDIRTGNGTTALFEATASDRVEVMRILLEAGADPNIDVKSVNNTPVFFADSKKALELLLNAGGELNLEQQFDGSTPIYGFIGTIANETPDDPAYQRHYELLEYALEQGADPNILTHDGQTVLSYAKDYNFTLYEEIIDLLISHGARP